MYCRKCGKQIDDEAIMCPYCGEFTDAFELSRENQRQERTNGMAIAGFVLSFFIFILGIVFSAIGYVKSKECNSGRGLAIAGLVISVTMTVLCIIEVVF